MTTNTSGQHKNSKGHSSPPSSIEGTENSMDHMQLIPPGSFLEVPLFDNAINQWFWFVCVNLEFNKLTGEYIVLFEDGSEKLMKLNPEENGVKWKAIGTFNADFKISCFKKILKSTMPPQYDKFSTLVEGLNGGRNKATKSQNSSNASSEESGNASESSDGSVRKSSASPSSNRTQSSENDVSIKDDSLSPRSNDSSSDGDGSQKGKREEHQRSAARATSGSSAESFSQPTYVNKEDSDQNNAMKDRQGGGEKDSIRKWMKFLEAAQLICTSVPNEIVEEAEMRHNPSAVAIVHSIMEKVKDLIMQAVTFLRQEDMQWMSSLISMCQCNSFMVMQNALNFFTSDDQRCLMPTTGPEGRPLLVPLMPKTSNSSSLSSASSNQTSSASTTFSDSRSNNQKNTLTSKNIAENQKARLMSGDGVSAMMNKPPPFEINVVSSSNGTGSSTNSNADSSSLNNPNKSMSLTSSSLESSANSSSVSGSTGDPSLSSSGSRGDSSSGSSGEGGTGTGSSSGVQSSSSGSSGDCTSSGSSGGERSDGTGGGRSDISGGERSDGTGGGRSDVSGGERSDGTGGGRSDASGGERSDGTGGGHSDASGGERSDGTGGGRSDASGGERSDGTGGGRSDVSGGERSDGTGGGHSDASGGERSDGTGGGHSDGSGGERSDASGGDGGSDGSGGEEGYEDSVSSKQHGEIATAKMAASSTSSTTTSTTSASTKNTVVESKGQENNMKLVGIANEATKSVKSPSSSEKSAAVVAAQSQTAFSSGVVNNLLMLADQMIDSSSMPKDGNRLKQLQLLQGVSQQTLDKLRDSEKGMAVVYHEEQQNANQQFQLEQSHPNSSRKHKASSDASQDIQIEEGKKKRAEGSFSQQRQHEHQLLLQRHQHLLQQHQLHRQQQLQKQQEILEQQRQVIESSDTKTNKNNSMDTEKEKTNSSEKN